MTEILLYSAAFLGSVLFGFLRGKRKHYDLKKIDVAPRISIGEIGYRFSYSDDELIAKRARLKVWTEEIFIFEKISNSKDALKIYLEQQIKDAELKNKELLTVKLPNNQFVIKNLAPAIVDIYNSKNWKYKYINEHDSRFIILTLSKTKKDYLSYSEIEV